MSEKDITSKDKVVAYMLNHVPQKYERILKEALHIRTGHGQKQYSLPVYRRRDMIEYMEYMIDECNRLGSKIVHFTGSSNNNH